MSAGVSLQRVMTAATVGLAVLCGQTATATQLTFLNATGRTPDGYGTLGNIGETGYGDRVDFGAAMSGSDAYGGYLRGNGWTPNVTVDYRTGNAQTGYGGVGLSWGATLDKIDENSDGAWGNGNDANGNPIIVHQSVWGIEPGGTNAIDPFLAPEIILKPDPGYALVLNNYLFHAYDPPNHTLDLRTMQVLKADGSALFNYTEPEQPPDGGYWWNYYGVDGYTNFNATNDPILSLDEIRIIGIDSYWYALGVVDFDQRLAGDVNVDGQVDIFDVATVSNNWGLEQGTGDANGDRMVDIFDVAVISNNWGAGVPSGAASVPEPAAFWLLAVGAGAIAIRRRLAKTVVSQNRWRLSGKPPANTTAKAC